jgi:hypothetical protein
MKFFFKFSLMCQQSDSVPIICCRCLWLQWQIATGVANLPSVSLIPVVHLDLQISPQILEKNPNDPKAIIRGLGKMSPEKNQKQRILWHCPFKPRAVRTSAKSCLHIWYSIFYLIGHQRKINITDPNRPVFKYMSSAKISQQPGWYRSILLFPWNYKRTVISVSECSYTVYTVCFFFFRGLYDVPHFTSWRSNRHSPNFQTFKDPRRLFHGIDSLWEIDSVVELILAARRGRKELRKKREYISSRN